MASDGSLLALDVGERRIGVAIASGDVAIAVPYDTIIADGTEVEQIVKLFDYEHVTTLVVGYPRNQSGEPTAQTEFTLNFVARLPQKCQDSVVYQDESLTSVQAEARLRAGKKSYQKSDIDSMAASIILQDYLERHYGRN